MGGGGREWQPDEVELELGLFRLLGSYCGLLGSLGLVGVTMVAFTC